MKLEGSLDAFSLPDIFQLLSFTKKSGGLHLAHDGSDGVVYFAGGSITGASADSSRQPLARRLVGSGTVDDDALRSAVATAEAGEGVGVVRALLEQQAVDGDLLRQAATDQSVDAVFDLLRWDTGDFAFVVDETNPDDVGVALAVETVLADAEARRSTWEAVSQVVPSPRAVLAMPVVLPTEPQVSREEWSLLALVDGRRTVGDLVDLTGSGQYAVVSTLSALVQRGLLEVRPGAGEDAASEDHVAVVVRRQALLAPLEGQPFVPVQEAAEAVAEPVEGEAAAEPVADEAEVADTDLPEQGGEQVAVDAVSEHEVADEASGRDDTDQDRSERELASASAGEGPQMLGGAHVPQDVVPPRPEPFLPKRQADFDEDGAPAHRPVAGVVLAAGPSATVGDLASHGGVVGATATAPDPASSVIERDPNVNRSLMLRLIAGVRGL